MVKTCRELDKNEEISRLETEKVEMQTDILLLKKEKSIKEDSKNLYGQAKYRKGLMDINKAIKKANVS